MGRPATLRAALLDHLRKGPATITAMAAATGKHRGAVNSTVMRMEELRLVRRKGTVAMGRQRSYLYHLVENAA